MLNKKYVTNEIRTQIAENLKNDGFKYIKAKERIIRKHDNGFDVIYIRVVDYAPIFLIEYSIAIRLNTVEDSVNKFLGEELFNPKNKPLTTTVASSYDLLSGTNHKFIEISSEDELKTLVQKLIELTKNKAYSFFQTYRSLSNTNKLKKNQILNDDTGLSNILRNLMQSLTLMKLCNDPDFDELCEKYKELYAPWVGQEVAGRKAMDDLISNLKSKTQDSRP
ncbi:hypothetical protein [Carboxylicivirga taeanensis]|uniref:hypothetical protein n=1 Tax=Carboxylicivirga taeanensis TaxID=1416875 RepID=UPI003F6E1B5B